MVTTLLFGLVLFLALLSIFTSYLAIRATSRSQSQTHRQRQVPRNHIPADWDRIMQETALQDGKTKRTKK